MHVSKHLPSGRPRGLTLVEIVVAACIIVVLAAICFSASSRLRKSGDAVKELAAARNLTSALALASQDKGGVLPFGFDSTISSLQIDGSGFRGKAVHGEAAHRYPWRLAPYFGYQFEGTTVIDSALRYTLEKKDTYMLSLTPSLGMNVYGVGGYVEFGAKEPIPGAILNMANAHAPEKMIAFASARLSHSELDGIAPGFHMVTPPVTPGGDWSPRYDEKQASSWGNIDLRYGGKAVVGHLDGSVAMLGRDEISDMRRWNNEASRLNNRAFRPGTATTTGGTRRDR